MQDIFTKEIYGTFTPQKSLKWPRLNFFFTNFHSVTGNASFPKALFSKKNSSLVQRTSKKYVERNLVTFIKKKVVKVRDEKLDFCLLEAILQLNILKIKERQFFIVQKGSCLSYMES